MKYRLAEVQVIDGHDFHGMGFDILDEHGASIVTFGYLDSGDAVKAHQLVERAIAEAKLVFAPKK